MRFLPLRYFLRRRLLALIRPRRHGDMPPRGYSRTQPPFRAGRGAFPEDCPDPPLPCLRRRRTSAHPPPKVRTLPASASMPRTSAWTGRHARTAVSGREAPRRTDSRDVPLPATRWYRAHVRLLCFPIGRRRLSATHDEAAVRQPAGSFRIRFHGMHGKPPGRFHMAIARKLAAYHANPVVSVNCAKQRVAPAGADLQVVPNMRFLLPRYFLQRRLLG